MAFNGEKAHMEQEGDVTLEDKLARYRGVWVFIESNGGFPAKVSWELLGIGKKLAASLEVALSAVVVGHNVESLCEEAFSFGADQAYLMDDEVYRNYRTASYQEAVCFLIDRIQA